MHDEEGEDGEDASYSETKADEAEDEEGRDDVVEKGVISLTETSTQWLLTVAGTCIDLDSDDCKKGAVAGTRSDREQGIDDPQVLFMLLL